MLFGIFLYFFPAEALLRSQKIINGVIDAVIVSPGIRAVFGNALCLLHEAYFFLCRQDHTLKPHPLLPQQFQCLLSHRSGNGFGRQIKELSSQSLSHPLYGRINGGNGFSHSCGRLQKQFLLMINRAIHIRHKLLLPVPICKRKRQTPDRLLTQILPIPGVISPFTIRTQQLIKPLSQFFHRIIGIEVSKLFRWNMAISHSHLDFCQALLQPINISITLCLC